MGAAEWGVQRRWQDAGDNWHEVSPETEAAMLEAMGTDGEGSPPPGPTQFVRPGQDAELDGPAELLLEDGAVLRIEGALPPDLPLGYHAAVALEDGRRTEIVVSPGVCPLPPHAPAWGWAVQLYALRSTKSWGMGDLGDLRRLGRWSSGELGAGLILVNPLHAAHPTLPQSTSPYFPSSRRFRNPLYLRVEDVDGAESLEGLDELAAAGRALNSEPHIDRDRVFRLKMQALERLWEGFEGDSAFDTWREAQGDQLGDYAAFCVLAEEHGPDWRRWPEGARHPDGPDVAEVRRTQYGRWRFHQWLQWLVDRQLQAASADIDVMHDLAVGVDPAGADGWLWQDQLALDMAVGAPPDEFNTHGQSWGLPPFDPWRLRRAGYQPFIQTIRATLGHAGGIRLDHVMGLFRLWWVPRGASPKDGAYVRYPAGDLLDIVALECHRAGAYAVGEDLGTVEAHVRDELRDRGVLSYRLLWFEEEPPAEYPVQALAAVTTHDLPTVAGLWTGRDLQDQKDIGLEPNEEGTRGLCEKVQQLIGLDHGAPVDDVVAATYSALAEAPSMLLAAGPPPARGGAARPPQPRPPPPGRGAVYAGGGGPRPRRGRRGPPQHARDDRPVAELADPPAAHPGGDRGRPASPDGGRRPRPEEGRGTPTMMIAGLRLWIAGTNAWVVSATGAGGECVLVDVPPDPGAILAHLEEHDLRLVALLATHGHVDHVGGVGETCRAQGEEVPVHIHDHDRHMLLDPVGTGGTLGQVLDYEELDLRPPELLWGLDDGQQVSGAGMTFTAIHTPGHTRGSTCFLLEVEGDAPVLFSGDHLFAGSIGRTDLPGGSHAQLLASMAEKILPLDDAITVLPGHGDTTTIGKERATNPFLVDLLRR